MRMLDKLGVPFRCVIERQEYEQYAAVIDPAKLLILPEHYLDDFDTCDRLGRSRPVGPGAARNYCWDLAQAAGAARHWVLDDNIPRFYRLHQNNAIQCKDGTAFRLMEDFCDRYTNIAHAGPQYFMFAPQMAALPPVVFNTRVFSCHLLMTDLPFRWRARYNDDVDLSLRFLKAGYCVAQFNAFLQWKSQTQTVKGGLTELYKADGTMTKSKMLHQLHPDVTRIVWRFGRWHHYVDYSGFRGNRLIRRPDVEIPATTRYPLRLVKEPA